jgi:hypothetical protein
VNEPGTTALPWNGLAHRALQIAEASIACYTTGIWSHTMSLHVFPVTKSKEINNLLSVQS